MRIVVCVKQVPDTAARLEVRPGSLRPHLAGIVGVISPFDEFALEEALRLRGDDGEVIALTLATEPVDETVFHVLAMGADRAVVLDAQGGAQPDVRSAAALLADAARSLGPDLLLCGERAVDDEMGAVAAAIAEALSVPQATGVERIDLHPHGRTVRARCRRGATVEVHALPIPAVFSCVRGERLPRYPTMDNIFDAGMKPVETRRVRCEASASMRRVALTIPGDDRAAEMLAGDAHESAAALVERIAVRTPVLR